MKSTIQIVINNDLGIGLIFTDSSWWATLLQSLLWQEIRSQRIWIRWWCCWIDERWKWYSTDSQTPISFLLLTSSDTSTNCDRKEIQIETSTNTPPGVHNQESLKKFPQTGAAQINLLALKKTSDQVILRFSWIRKKASGHMIIFRGTCS